MNFTTGHLSLSLASIASTSGGIISRRDIDEVINNLESSKVHRKTIERCISELIHEDVIVRISRGLYRVNIGEDLKEKGSGEGIFVGIAMLQKIFEEKSLSDKSRAAFFGHTALRIYDLGNFMPTNDIHVAVGSATDAFNMRQAWAKIQRSTGSATNLITHISPESLLHSVYTSRGPVTDKIQTAIDIATTDDQYEAAKIFEELMARGVIYLEKEEDIDTLASKYGENARALAKIALKKFQERQKNRGEFRE
jgi:Transcriptional regulator, AbiEi antitoxin